MVAAAASSGCWQWCRQMKKIGSGQLMVTEGDKVMMPNLIGASRMAPSQLPHQQLLLHSIQEDGSSQVTQEVDALHASHARSFRLPGVSAVALLAAHLCGNTTHIKMSDAYAVYLCTDVSS